MFKVRNATTQPPCPQPPAQHCCTFGTPAQAQCACAATAGECHFYGGVPGDGASVCDSVTGRCTPPPAAAGNCCEGFTTVFGTNCGAGPGIPPSLCTQGGGTVSASAVRTVSGSCSPSGAFLDPIGGF